MLDEELEKSIEKLASTFFSEEEIAEILEVRELTIEMKRAIRKYKLISEAETRAAVFEQAQAGSSPAQTLAMKIIEADKRKEY